MCDGDRFGQLLDRWRQAARDLFDQSREIGRGQRPRRVRRGRRDRGTRRRECLHDAARILVREDAEEQRRPLGHIGPRVGDGVREHGGRLRVVGPVDDHGRVRAHDFEAARERE